MSKSNLLEFEYAIKAGESTTSGARLDLYLCSLMTDFSRSHIQKLIDEGQVKVNTKTAKAGWKLKGGEKIQVTLPEPKNLDLTAEAINLDIVYEDEYLLVINKTAGMVVHPGAGIHEGTLVNALLHHCRNSLSQISGVLRPGIVHRLDKDTSGLLVVAKEDQTHRHLAEQIRSKTAKRTYFAILEGLLNPSSGSVNKPIGRHPTRRKEMCILESGRHAITHFEVVDEFTKYSFVKLQLETGRTHQIRVHMASLNAPVIGDIVYNKKLYGSLEKRNKLGLKGHALHATQLSFIHPISGHLLECEAPLPEDFKQLLARFGKSTQ